MQRSRRIVFLIVLVVIAMAAATVARAHSVSTGHQVADDEVDKARGLYIW